MKTLEWITGLQGRTSVSEEFGDTTESRGQHNEITKRSVENPLFIQNG